MEFATHISNYSILTNESACMIQTCLLHLQIQKHCCIFQLLPNSIAFTLIYLHFQLHLSSNNKYNI